MNFGSIDPLLLLASLMVAATPILLAAIGELVVERAGVLNLGVEGMMISGSVLGFVAAIWFAGLDCSVRPDVWFDWTARLWQNRACPAITYWNPAVFGFVAAAVGGAVMALVFGILTQFFLSNQVATGLALTLFGLGLASLLGQGYLGVKAPSFPDWDIPILGDIPVIGPIVFQHDPMVYVGLGIVGGVWWFLNKTRGGLILRAVGENHEAAHALGYHVVRTRMLAIMFGGACAGLGGAYLSIVRVPTYADGLTAGAGWIALAIVVFASWKPGRLLLGAYLFGGVTVLQLNLQAAGLSFLVVLCGILVVAAMATLIFGLVKSRGISKSSVIWVICLIGAAVLIYGYQWMGWPFNETLWLSSSPYIATIFVLVIMASGGAPGSLGKTFHAAR